MRLSRVGYYADFVVYPALIFVLTVIEFRSPESTAQIEWLVACIAGVAGWTLIEYFIHRFVFHQIPAIARMHDMHHMSPGALIGAPLWLSLSAFAFGAFIPLWWEAGFDVASGTVNGLILGYLWYSAVHTAIHRWELNRTSLLYRAKLRHAHHHFGKQDGNFGVTTSLWDRFFGTAIRN